MGKVFVACALGCLFGCGAKKGAAENTTSADAIKTPATVEQAAKILDLSTFPLMDGAKLLESRQVANLFYLATGDVKTAFEFNRKALLAQGWKELPNSSVTDQSASAMFSRDGFVVYVSVSPHGEPGSVQVRLQNQGNVKPGSSRFLRTQSQSMSAIPARIMSPRPLSLRPARPAAISSSRKAGCPMAMPRIPPSSSRTQSSQRRISRPHPRRAARP